MIRGKLRVKCSLRSSSRPTIGDTRKANPFPIKEEPSIQENLSAPFSPYVGLLP